MQHIRTAAFAVAMAAGFTFAAPPDFAGKKALEADPTLDAIPGSVLVTFTDNALPSERAAARALAATSKNRTFGLVPSVEHLIVRDADLAIQMLQNLPWVKAVEPDYVVRTTATPNDEFYGLMWGLHNTGQAAAGNVGTPDSDIDAPEAWDITTGDPNFVVAVIDSGVQWTHPDLQGNIWTNPGEIAGNGIDDDGNGFVDDVRGWDFFDGDNDPDDGDGHGTHVAGTIGAVGNNGIGTVGVMWQCKIMPLRFIGQFGGSTADAIASIDYAVANGAKLSNNSWGGGGFNTALSNAISNAEAAGHLLVIAQGNDGVNTDNTPVYPAAYPQDNIIGVANINSVDGLEFDSNYGAVSCDLGAPGDDIASLYSGSSYVYLRGTSMASPHVAGVAGLVWSQNPSWSYADVKNQLMGTVRPIASLQGNSVSGGMVNAFAALTGTPPPPPPAAPAAPSNLALADGGAGVVNISWSDNSDNEDGFEIEFERRVKRNRWGETTTGTVGADATSASTTLTAGEEYRFRIRSFNGGGSSAWTGYANIVLSGGGDGGGGGGGGGGNGGGNGGGKPNK